MSKLVARAVKPSISDDGKGQGCDERYWMSVTVSPTSSNTSRATVSSRLSPGSTKPASTECMPGGKRLWRPSTIRSPPSWTSMITAGSVRGKWWVAQSGLVQSRMCPPSADAAGDPQTPQKRWRAFHQTMPRA